MMTALKRTGYKTAILSGGFTYFGNYLKQRFGFDYVYANELEIKDGKLTYLSIWAISSTDAEKPNCSGCSRRWRMSTSNRP